MNTEVIIKNEIDYLLEHILADENQMEMPLHHQFSEGIYARTICMPKGTVIIGKVHKTRHLNVILQGKAKVYMEGSVRNVEAPCIIESNPGVRKVLYIEEDMLWTTIHATEETDVEVLENTLVEQETLEDLKINNKMIKELLCHIS